MNRITEHQLLIAMDQTGFGPETARRHLRSRELARAQMAARRTPAARGWA